MVETTLKRKKIKLFPPKFGAALFELRRWPITVSAELVGGTQALTVKHIYYSSSNTHTTQTGIPALNETRNCSKFLSCSVVYIEFHTLLAGCFFPLIINKVKPCGCEGARIFFEMEADQGCRTPTNEECQIPMAVVCPRPPRKKMDGRTKTEPPKNGYFQSPELDRLLGAVAQGRVAWA